MVFNPPDDFLKASTTINEWIADYLEHSEKYPVLPNVRPGDIRKALPAQPPQSKESFEQIWQDFQNIILPGVTHWNHPSFYAYFAITGSAPGVLGEMLSAALNINGMLWKTCPAATELEEVTLGWLREMLRLPSDFFGVIMDTASVGSLCALAAARESLGLGIREEGIAGRDLPRLRVYTSEQSHSSIEKGAIVLGFGQKGVRAIPVDDQFRMRPDLLKAAIEEDLRAGWKPSCVVATVGTTSTSSIDPVPEIAAICEAHKIWLHVDAAYAGSAGILPGKRWILDGCERADSFLFNPHKWLFVPFDCTAFYTRRPQVLAQAFSLVPEYLRTSAGNEVQNYMDYGIQLGRRFRALKLWMVIRMYGVQGLQSAIKRHIELAELFTSWIEQSADFELLAPVPLSLVCFRARPAEYHKEKLDELNQKLMDAVNQTGKAFLSHTKLKGKLTLRLAIGNLNTERRHIEQVWNLLNDCLASLL